MSMPHAPLDDDEHDADGVMHWKKVEPPLWWEAGGLHIIADRHLPDGTRQHMIEGKAPKGLVIGGAQVFGKDDLPNTKFSLTLSHLSGRTAPRPRS
jgi:hypothetical protein